MKSFRCFFVVFVLVNVLIGHFPVNAQEELYYVSDANTQLNEEFGSYEEAFDYYTDNLDSYDNLILRKEDSIIQMEYGIVEFKTGNACSITVDYHSQSKNSNDYLNGCYGVDAAYLSTSRKGDLVYFMISADEGYTSIDNVILHPIEEVTGLSAYSLNDGRLTHNIRTQLKDDFYSYSLSLDDAPSFMEKDQEYYSYDGHYFYTDFRAMIDDYRRHLHDNAVNEEPYYSYFQYLPHRSLTNYTIADGEGYLDSLGIDQRLRHYTDFNNDNAADEVNRSQLFGQMHSFFIYQNIYGTNALMLLSAAINESSYGKSYLSFVRNNLYATSAYESDIERENNRYDSVDSSIYAHAKYFISSMYSNHLKDSYSGTFFGNKLSGINADYSLDPYYGERNASTYYELDKALGEKDRNDRCLGIITDRQRLRFYRDADMDKLLFAISDVNELSLVILGETEDAYKVSVDASFSDEYIYDFDSSTGYVSKKDFDLILNSDRIEGYELTEIEHDFDGGSFIGHGSLKIKYLHAEDAQRLIPHKDGYEFIGYDDSMTAQYRRIKSIELIKGLDNRLEFGQPVDLSGCVLRISYDDSSKDIPLDSDMISGFDPFTSGVQIVHISYNGVVIDRQIEVSEELSGVRENIAKAIEGGDYDTVKSLLIRYGFRYPFSFSQIRTINYELMQKNGRNYVIYDETERYNLSISGLDLSLPDISAFSFIRDTYYVLVRDIDAADEEKIYELAKGYGFEKNEGIDISFRFNYQDIELIGPAIVQLDLKDKKNDLVYTVYHLSEEGDIIKCRTTQSESYIQFLINESGSYLVLSKPSVNKFDFEDQTEDLSYENMGFDNHRTNISLMSMIVLILLGIIGIIVYYIYNDKRKKLWRDFRKSLRTAGCAQEEKPKN